MYGDNVTYNDLTYVEIDLAAILHNITVIKRWLASQHSAPPGILAVVKSDAYGHGMIPVAQTILPHVWGLAVFDVTEAITLRNQDINCPIVLISGILKEAAKAVCEYGLTPAICDIVSLNALEDACKAQKTTCSAHLKVDTGMSRMGFMPDELLDVLRKTRKWPHVSITGIFSHMCCANEPENPMNTIQISLFEEIHQNITKLNFGNLLFHLANSAAMLHLPQTHYDLVRPGLAIYGGHLHETNQSPIAIHGNNGNIPLYPHYLQRTGESPVNSSEAEEDSESTGLAQGGLWQAMSLKTHVIATKDIRKNSVVSYGATYRAKQDMRIAILPVGYDNGYFRSLSNMAQVLIKGIRAPVIGRICMKSMIIDVTHIPGDVMGEQVVLLGQQGTDRISWKELAQCADTIDYELMCAIGAKNFRKFLNETGR